MEITTKIIFADENVKQTYIELEKTFQEKQLKQHLDKAFERIQQNAFSGTQIPKKLIPKEYQTKYGPLDNLWKYDLPNAWRLIYTIKNNGIIVLSIILEWYNHKEYERKFKY